MSKQSSLSLPACTLFLAVSALAACNDSHSLMSSTSASTPVNSGAPQAPSTGSPSVTPPADSPSNSGSTTAAASANDNGADSTAAVDVSQLCLTTDCGHKETLLRLPGAETLLFTPTGRLFATGSGFFEITRDAQGALQLITIESAVFRGGLALIGDVLYINDPIGKQLLATRLDTPDKMVPKPIFALPDIEFANGLQRGRGNDLYIADFSPVPNAGLVHLVIDPNDPFRILREETVLAVPTTAAANGLALRDDTLFYTDTNPTGVVRSFPLGEDGNIASASAIRTIYTGAVGSLFDEINFVGDKLLFCDMGMSQVNLIDRDGNVLLQSAPLTFLQPSSAFIGRPPLFAPTDVVVTEQGVPIEGQLPVGNVLSVFRRDR